MGCTAAVSLLRWRPRARPVPHLRAYAAKAPAIKCRRPCGSSVFLSACSALHDGVGRGEPSLPPTLILSLLSGCF